MPPTAPHRAPADGRDGHDAGPGPARPEAGSTTASFVVLFPLLVLVFMALVQWGLVFHARSVVDAAADDAGRVAAGADASTGDGRATALQLLAPSAAGGLLSEVSVEVSEEAGTVRAVVRGRVRSLVPLPGGLEVEGVADVPKERFVAPGAP